MDPIKYLPMAWKVAKDTGYLNILDRNDIESAAGLAYVNALRLYDPDKGPWATYLAVSMKNEMLKAVRSTWGFGMRQGYVIKTYVDQVSSESAADEDREGDSGDRRSRGSFDEHSYVPDYDTAIAARQIFRILCDKIGPDRAVIFTLKVAYDWTFAQIAATVGKSRQRVHQIWHEQSDVFTQAIEEIRREHYESVGNV